MIVLRDRELCSVVRPSYSAHNRLGSWGRLPGLLLSGILVAPITASTSSALLAAAIARVCRVVAKAELAHMKPPTLKATTLTWVVPSPTNLPAIRSAIMHLLAFLPTPLAALLALAFALSMLTKSITSPRSRLTRRTSGAIKLRRIV